MSGRIDRLLPVRCQVIIARSSRFGVPYWNESLDEAGCRVESARALKEAAMSTTETRSAESGVPAGGNIDLKLEVVVIPVSDVERAKSFYEGLGWRLDADFPFENGFRVVQFTPPGSGCSLQFGTKMTSAAPGSAQGLYLIVPDIEAARSELAARGA